MNNIKSYDFGFQCVHVKMNLESVIENGSSGDRFGSSGRWYRGQNMTRQTTDQISTVKKLIRDLFMLEDSSSNNITWTLKDNLLAIEAFTN